MYQLSRLKAKELFHSACRQRSNGWWPSRFDWGSWSFPLRTTAAEALVATARQGNFPRLQWTPRSSTMSTSATSSMPLASQNAEMSVQDSAAPAAEAAGSVAATTTTATAATDDTSIKKVTEGSCHMCFAATEETAVFYNPVQVQNRDLSVLMMTLYAERRRATEVERLAKRAAKKQLRQQQAQPSSSEAVEAKAAATTATTDSTDANDDTNPNHVATPVQNQDVASAINGGADDEEHVVDLKLHVLDALAASGLRSMRYWKECPDIYHVTINDLDPAAYDRARQNIDSNGLTPHLIAPTISSGRPYGIRIQTSDATQVMYNSRQSHQKRPNEPRSSTNGVTGTPLTPDQESSRQWDIIDLDPYGSAAPFIDAAVQAIVHGGMLNVTCTDMAALGGSHPETCFGRYAALPISRAGYLQELAVRILLYALATSAARYGRSIRPILSVGMDFYVRVFVEVYDDKAAVNRLSLCVGNVYQSTQCPSFYVVPSGQLGGKKGNVYQPSRLTAGLCTETGSALKVAGPLWTGPMHNQDVLKVALARLEATTTSTTTTNTSNSTTVPSFQWIATRNRLRGLLTSCLEELPDAPLFYRLPDLAKCLHLSTPPLVDMKSALINAGYRVSGYHKDPQAIKTDAPTTVVWDILRAWSIKRPPIKPAEADSTAAKILAVAPSIVVDFTTPTSSQNSAATATATTSKVSRFPMNPQANWGPKPRASGIKRKADGTD